MGRYLNQMEGGTSVLEEFRCEWDDEGVYFYQANCDEIAQYALTNQRFGGPLFNPTRMTWIKPSFAWMMYRSGYGTKHGQTKVLKVKLSHAAVADLLNGCACKQGGGGSLGRVQWDPAREMEMSDLDRKMPLPRRFLNRRDIQIGLKERLSEMYVASVLSIEDVTQLAGKLKETHSGRSESEVRRKVEELQPELPLERVYLPACTKEKLVELRLREKEF